MLTNKKQATCVFDCNLGLSVYSLLRKLLMILAAGSLYFWIIKFNYNAVYGRQGVCGLGCCHLCVLNQTVHAVLAGFKLLAFS